jgi:ATP-dependent DNA helicase PIF1
MGDGDAVLSVASSGIAATLLINGRTFHSQFKLYPPITDTTTSRIDMDSFEAHLIRRVKLVVWDEATMTPKYALDAVDALLRSIFKKPYVPFGGMVMLLGGDFRQCLPIVPHGRRVDVIESTIQMCSTWPLFKFLRLTKNMRTPTDSQEYADWLRMLGDDDLTSNTPDGELGQDVIEIPQDFILPQGTFVQHVFGADGEILQPENEHELCNRAILCPRNEDCRDINYHVVSKLMPGRPLHTYHSMNCVACDDSPKRQTFRPSSSKA